MLRQLILHMCTIRRKHKCKRHEIIACWHEWRLSPCTTLYTTSQWLYEIKHTANNSTSLRSYIFPSLYTNRLYLQPTFKTESENYMPNKVNSFGFQFVELCLSSRFRFLCLLIKCVQWNRRWHKKSFPILQIGHTVGVSSLSSYAEYTFISIRRRVRSSITTGFPRRSISTLLSKVVFNFFNSVNLLEFSNLGLHDCICWSLSLCFNTMWKSPRLCIIVTLCSESTCYCQNPRIQESDSMSSWMTQETYYMSRVLNICIYYSYPFKKSAPIFTHVYSCETSQ